jgi:small subunit ribosomal protein S1
VKVGDEVEALVLQKEDKEGRLILSKKRAQYERAWGTIEKIKEEDGVVTGTVIEVVKGGLILDIGLRGFLPASLVEMRRVRDLQPYVGMELEAKIIELDKNRNNVVLSRRAWLEQTQSEVRQNFLTQLAKGQIRKGVVSSIVNFGAFVDLGGVDGLVHVSELSWKHIDHPSEVVEVGQEVTVEVLDVDMDRERVSLSLKATKEDPWQAFARTHQIGQIVPGKVTKLVPFGAFVRVEEGIEGLVHVSELSWKHIDHPSEVVEVGQEVEVEVLDVDLDRERVSLSLKATQEDPWRQFARTHAINQIVPGKVTKLVPFGAFVRVDDGIEGLVHISELAERHVEIPEQVVQVGNDVMVKVIDIDLERRRISLSLKQANEGFVEGEEHFDPTLYGMAATYDNEGNYIYPEGFDPETGEWLEGFDKQRETWERQYAEARERWEAHTKQVQSSREADAEAALNPVPAGGVTSSSSTSTSSSSSSSSPAPARPAEEPSGTLATDEALAALREKLAGGKS